MITTRTRFLSILATVAMLVSMLACFIIPASAAELADYEEVLADIASGATNLEAEVAKGAEATPESLKTAAEADAAAGTIEWKNFDWKNEPYPCYALHEAYEAAGYTGLNWSISDVADWTAMDTYAMADGTPNNYFSGVTFHVTQDIDFGSTAIYPLGAYDGRNFSGTINGHGNGFSNIKIEVLGKSEVYYNNGPSTGSIGLIAYLGSCTIQDFGLNSGTIETKVNKYGSVSSFGCVASDLTTPPTFTRVWSGVTLQALKTDNYAKRVFMSALVGVRDNNVPAIKVNGFVFDGQMNKAGSNNAYNIGFGVYGAFEKAPCDNSEFYNVITYPKDSGATSLTTYVLHFSTEDAFKTAMQSNKILNVYGLARNDDKVGIADSYRYGETPGTLTAGSVDNTEGDGAYNLISTKSAVETAWTINSNPTATDPVYFTLKNNKIYPVATADKAIVKVSVNDNAEFVNNGTTYTKAELAAKAELSEDGITKIMVNGVDKTADTTFTIDGNTTIILSASADAMAEMLAEAVAKYSALETKYFTAESVTKINEFVAAANEAGSNVAAIEAALAQAEALEGELATYSTYPMEEGKEIPAYSQYATFKAYNKNKTWTINEPADWLAMVAASKYDADGGTLFDGSQDLLFTDDVFHLTQDIDFASVTDPMDPLCFGKTGKDNETLGAFDGTIDGHGYAFKNINVTAAGTDTGLTTSIGMICKLGYNAEIKDFGVDSGTITGKGPAKHLYVSTFGEVLNNANSTAKLTRVWSGANIVADSSDITGSAIAVGLSAYGRCTNSKFVLNGGYFFGTLDSAAASKVGVYYDTRNESIYNSLSDTANATHMIDVHDKGTIANNRSVGVPVLGGADDGGSTHTDTNNAQVTSALIGAYEINTLQETNPITDVDKIYYTITENGIRPLGTEANRIVKVAVNEDDALYININQEYTKAELEVLFGKTILEVTAGENATYENDVLKVTDDAAIAVTFEEILTCDHSANTNETYTKVDGEDKHVLLCSECGEATADAVDCDGTWVADEVNMENGTSGHTMECAVCHEIYTEECNGTKAYDPADCTVAHEWQFSCGVHEAEYVIPGSAKADHEFSGEWADVEGVENKQYKQCANCSTKIYQYVDTISATGIELAPVETGDIVITLPANLATADLTFTVPEGYTITNVSGAAAEGEIYKATASTVTVTVASTVASNGGIFKVEMANAKANDDLAITDASAEATITFKPCDHSRNENTTYTKVDGEDKHVLLCSICGEATAEAEACDGTVVADSNIDAEGKSKHTMTCDKCGTDYEYECTATKYFDPADCTVAHEWRFDCGVHEAAYVIEGSAKADHEFSGEWADVEGVDDKQYKTCANCTSTIYQYVGDINVTDIELAVNEAGNIVITLPANLATADLTFTVSEGYTIDNVVGATLDGELYKANSTTVTVHITAGEAANGGSFAVAMTNAKATDDLTIADASAEATITHRTVVCDHAANTNTTYTSVGNGMKKHVLLCSECGEATAPASDCTGTYVAADVNNESGESKHVMECTGCHEFYYEECNGTLYINPDDCTVDHEWKFECGIHESSYAIAESAKAAHDFTSSEWNYVEGEANKQYRTCANCSTKEYRYFGEVAAAGISLKPNAEGDIVITLPANVATADLTFTITGDYTIKSVVGATEEGGVYKATAATVTVSLNAASATAIGGTFKVEMTNAKATDDLAITDAAAEAEIALDGVAGDANGDNNLNLSDALSVLYTVVGKAGANPINTANADMNNDGNILIDDVYAIVSAWLKTRLATI